MVVNEPTAIARLGIDVNKISGFEMGCVESESPAMLRIEEDGFGSGDHLLFEDQCSLCSLCCFARFCQFCSDVRSVRPGHGNALRPYMHASRTLPV